MSIKKSLLVLFILFAFSISAQNFKDAEWIWQQEDGTPNSWVSFRKTVEIDHISEKVVANIAVDSRFWLWINGEMVVFEGGSSRGPSQAGEWNRKEKITPTNTWYQEVNINKYLKKGKNTIAVLVWYWGRETHKGTYIDSGKGGLLFQSKIGNQNIVSDKTWKVKRHTGYKNQDVIASESIVQYKVQYDARNDFNDWSKNAWYNSDFVDITWQSATEKGKPGIAPWYSLVENYVPALKNHGLKNYVNNEALEFPFLSDGKSISCKLPFNMQITPYLEIETEAGKVIEITTDNRLNKITANYTTKSGNQSFESFSWMNGHDVIYTIPKGVKVIALKYRWMSVGEMVGDFQVNDPFYQRLWEMGNNTLFICARDNFMDCPDRERALWIGDVADQANYLFYTMDNVGRQLLKKSILTTINFSENGVLGALGPLRNRELVGQSLQFIAQTVWLYYLHTGDIETLEKAYPFVKDYLHLFEMEENGFPKYRKSQSADSWDWVDWGVKNTVDKEPIQIAYYYMALDKAKEMAKILNKNEEVDWYNFRLKSIKNNFDTHFWKGNFYSSDASVFKDDRANGLMITSGLANEKYYDKIVENVLIPNRFSSPHFEWVVEEAMAIAGKYKESLARMKDQYQSQVDNKNLTTLYEMFPKGGSYNHAWNASNTILSKHIAGLQALKAAWSEYEIMPNMAHFNSIKKLVPTVKGDISLNLEKTENTFQIDLNSPKETKAFIGFPKENNSIVKITLKGKAIWSKGTVKKHRKVLSVTENEKYIKIEVASGEYQLKAFYQ